MVDEEENLEDRRHRIGATIAFFSEIIRFVIIPMVILDILLSYFPMITPEVGNRAANNVMVFGGMIAIFAAIDTYFPKGHVAKLVFGLLSVCTLGAWFWFILSGEEVNVPYGNFDLAVNLTGIIMLILVAVALKGLIPVIQFLDGRAEILLERKRAASVAACQAAAPTGAQRSTSSIFIPPAQRATVESLSEPAESDDEPPPPEDFAMKCPICRSEIPATVDVCPHCGAWIRHRSKL